MVVLVRPACGTCCHAKGAHSTGILGFRGCSGSPLRYMYLHVSPAKRAGISVRLIMKYAGLAEAYAVPKDACRVKKDDAKWFCHSCI
jgi:hypothetical protein